MSFVATDLQHLYEQLRTGLRGPDLLCKNHCGNYLPSILAEQLSHSKRADGGEESEPSPLVPTTLFSAVAMMNGTSRLVIQDPV